MKEWIMKKLGLAKKSYKSRDRINDDAKAFIDCLPNSYSTEYKVKVLRAALRQLR